MNFLSLEYFLAVCEELNITKAAERLYISQQSLSNSIIKLEKAVGTKLFMRLPNLSLTYAGQRLRSAASKILEIRTRVLTEIDDINKNRRGELKIGISHTRGCAILPQILPLFKQKHPLVEISLVEGNSESLENKLNHGMIDLMFGFLPFMLESVQTTLLRQERLYLVVPRSFTHEIFGDKSDFMRGKFSEAGDINAYKDCPMIMLNHGNRIRTMMDTYFSSHQISPNIILETENIETAFALAVSGMGITVYPEMFLKNIKHEGGFEEADLFPLATPMTVGTLAIGYSLKRYLSAAARDFIALAKEIFSSHSPQ